MDIDKRNLEENGRPLGSSAVRIYLQGKMVYESNRFLEDGGVYNVIHLDPKRFLGRLPDRDKLIDEYAVLKRVDQTIEGLWKEHCQTLLENNSQESIAKWAYPTFKKWDALELFNEIHYVPTGILAKYQEYPKIRTYWEDHDYREMDTLVSRDDLESGKVKVVCLENDAYEDSCSMLEAMYAYKLNLPFVTEIPKGHWIDGYITSVRSDDISMRVEGKSEEANIDLRYLMAYVTLCDELYIDGPAGSAKIDEACVDQDGAIFVPEADENILGDVVRQACSYIDESDAFDDEACEEDERTLSSLIRALRDKDPSKLLLGVLANEIDIRRTYKPLMGHSYKVAITEDGQISVDLLDH